MVREREHEDETVALRAKRLGVPSVALAPNLEIPAGVLELIPEEAAEHYQMIPLSRSGRKLRVGMVRPDDEGANEALKFLAARQGLDTEVVLLSAADFRRALGEYQTLHGEVSEALEELESELRREPRGEEAPAEGGEALEAEAPISKVVAVMLKHAVEGNASDIHIEPTERQLRVRFRVDGVLYTSLLLPLKTHPAIVSRIKILANLKIDETRIPQDGRFHITLDGKGIDIRVSTFPTSFGEKVALRILDPTIGIRSFEELGLAGRNLRVLKAAIKKPFGMILLSGPTGSGKSTTLYAALQVVNTDEVNIMTLEDPVEYYIAGVNQSEIRPEIGYTFAAGLRHILRQDPDIIMVGEIRDAETASLAVHAALTGHIVFSTLHTNDAVGVIPRLIDLKVEPFLLPASLSLAMAQRLVRRLCQACKKPQPLEGEMKKIVEGELEKLPPEVRRELDLPKRLVSYVSPGCPACNQRGTVGRIAIFEALEITSALEHIILTGPSESALKEEARRQGMLTMKQDGILKVLGGVVSLEEVLKAVEIND